MKNFIFLFCITFSVTAMASSAKEKYTLKWSQYQQEIYKLEQEEKKRGFSYILSGGIALVGGLAGAELSDDSIEKGVYTVFQTLGVASIGYGGYLWKVGDKDFAFYNSLASTRSLTDAQKALIVERYRFTRKQAEKKERVVKAITHGLVSVLNFYNGSQQDDGSLKDGMYFVAGVNLLVAASYTFEF